MLRGRVIDIRKSFDKLKRDAGLTRSHTSRTMKGECDHAGRGTRGPAWGGFSQENITCNHWRRQTEEIKLNRPYAVMWCQGDLMLLKQKGNQSPFDTPEGCLAKAGRNGCGGGQWARPGENLPSARPERQKREPSLSLLPMVRLYLSTIVKYLHLYCWWEHHCV